MNVLRYKIQTQIEFGLYTFIAVLAWLISVVTLIEILWMDAGDISLYVIFCVAEIVALGSTMQSYAHHLKLKSIPNDVPGIFGWCKRYISR